MGALIIVPAATAKRLAGNLSAMLTGAAAIAVAATAAGNGLAAWLHRQTGPLIVLVATGCFLLSFLWDKRRRVIRPSRGAKSGG